MPRLTIYSKMAMAAFALVTALSTSAQELDNSQAKSRFDLQNDFPSKGGIATGGGLATTDRYSKVELTFGDEGVAMRAKLKAFVNQLMKFPARGQHSALLQELVANGLLEDIDQSPYVFSKSCVEKGAEEEPTASKTKDEKAPPKEEKDASTFKGVRNAPICVNVPQLALKVATEEEMTGLMMHEHARHFGIEDTNSYGKNPLAVFVTERFKQFNVAESAREHLRPGYVKSLRRLHGMCKNRESLEFVCSNPLLKDASVLPTRFDDDTPTIWIYTTAARDLTLVVDEVEGKCPTEVVAKSGFTLQPGFRIPITRLTEDTHTLFKPRSGISSTCRVTISIENSYGKATVLDKVPYKDWNGFQPWPLRIDVKDAHYDRWSTEW